MKTLINKYLQIRTTPPIQIIITNKTTLLLMTLFLLFIQSTQAKNKLTGNFLINNTISSIPLEREEGIIYNNKSEKEGDVTSISNDSKNTSKNSTFREVANDDFKSIEEGSNTSQFYYILEQNFKNAISLENISVANQPFPNPDTDGDGVTDDIDVDDDNDGVLDTNEGCQALSPVPFSFLNSTFTDSGNSGGVGDQMIYHNVTTFNGKQIDLQLTVISNSNAANVNANISGFTFNSSLYHIHLEGSGASAISGTVAIQFSYLESGTSNPVDVSGIYTWQDIDGNGESITFVESDLHQYQLSTDTQITVDSVNNEINFQSTHVYGPLTEEKIWAVITTQPQSSFIVEVEKRNGNTGYIFTSNTLNSAATPVELNQLNLTCSNDSDGDTVLDHLDLDSDNDGIPDNIEAQSTADFTAPASDNAATYSTNNGLNSSYITSNGITPIDTDGDGLPDFIDLDSDNAQTDDTTEAGLTVSNNDSDNDGLDDNNDSNNGVYGPANAGITDPISTYPNNGQEINFRVACENGTTDAGLCILYEGRVFEDSGAGAGGIFGDCIENGDENSLNLPDGLYANVVQGSTLVYSSLLDSSGNYQIPHLEDGNYEIVITTDPLSTSVSLPNLYSFGANGWYFISVVNDVVTSPSSIPTICIQSCEFGKISTEHYASTSLGGYNIGPTVPSPNVEGAPDGAGRNLYGAGGSAISLEYATTFSVGSEITITGRYNDSRNGGLYLTFSTDGVTYTANSSLITGWTSNSVYEDITYTIPTSLTDNYSFIKVSGKDGTSYYNIDAVKVTYEICNDCPTGVDEPVLSATTITNSCPTQTMDLTSITASNQPANTTLTWHTGVPATDANKVSAPATAVAGIYYASFYSFTSQCYTLDGEAVTAVTADGDSDCDGVPNATDIDDDNDGVLDTNEGCQALSPVPFSFLNSTFTDSGNSGGVGDQMIYHNVTTFNGKQIDLQLTVISNSNAANVNANISGFTFNSSLYHIHLEGSGASAISGTVAIQFSYLESGTSNPVDVSGIYTWQDIDGNGESITFVESDLHQYQLSTDTQITVDSVNNEINFQSTHVYGPLTEEKIWAVITTQPQSSFIVEVEKRNGNTGYIFTSNTLNSAATPVELNQLNLTCSNDSDGDTVLDHLDLDSDNDGILDNIEAQNYSTYIAPSGVGSGITDSNGNGLDDVYESTPGVGLTPVNSDTDSLENFVDIDADNDGIPDNVELQRTKLYIAPSGIATSITDVNSNGVDDNYEIGGTVGIIPVDTELDGIPDYVDTDTDNDGLLDIAENGNNNNVTNGTDTDGDGLDDNFDNYDDTNISGHTVNNGINPPSASNLGDSDNDLATGGDVDFRDNVNTILITQVYQSAGKKMIEVTNIGAVQIPGGTFTLNLFSNNSGDMTGLTPSASYTITSPLNANQSIVIENSVGGSFSNINSGAISIIDDSITNFGDGDDIIILSTSSDTTSWANRIDVINSISNITSMVLKDEESDPVTTNDSDRWVVFVDDNLNPYLGINLENPERHPHDPLMSEILNASENSNMQLGYHRSGETVRIAGAWNNGIPDRSRRVIINEDYLHNDGSDLSARQLTIDNNSKLTIQDKLLIVSDVVTITGINDEIRLAGTRSQLITTHSRNSGISGNGKLYVDQNSDIPSTYRYNYFSSPVTTVGQNTFSVASVMKDGSTATSSDSNAMNMNWTNDMNGSPTSPITIADYWIYSFGSSSDWVQTRKDGILNPADGFTFKGPGQEQNYTFVGTPNDGLIETTVSPNTSYLVGNPFPSAINSKKFIQDNIGSIYGTLYFWEQHPGLTEENDEGHYSSNYVGGYATRNLTMGIAAPNNGDDNIIFRVPGKYIPIAQGFFITGSNTGGEVVFKNSQREYRYEGDDSVFFRDGENNEVSETYQDPVLKIGLDYTNSNNQHLHRQVGVSFNKDRSFSFDLGYDSPLYEPLENDIQYRVEETKMFWKFEEDDTKYVIAGIQEFSTDIEIPIGFSLEYDGEIIVKLDEQQNFEQDVYLKDKLTGATYKLSDNEQGVAITLSTGSHLDKYAIVFVESSLNTDDDMLLENQLGVYIDHMANELVLKNYQNLDIKKVGLYNILGQTIKTWNNLGTDTEYRKGVQLPAAIYVVRITTENGEFVKKIRVD